MDTLSNRTACIERMLDERLAVPNKLAPPGGLVVWGRTVFRKPGPVCAGSGRSPCQARRVGRSRRPTQGLWVSAVALTDAGRSDGCQAPLTGSATWRTRRGSSAESQIIARNDAWHRAESRPSGSAPCTLQQARLRPAPCTGATAGRTPACQESRLRGLQAAEPARHATRAPCRSPSLSATPCPPRSERHGPRVLSGRPSSRWDLASASRLCFIR